MKLGDILRVKGTQVYTVRPDQTVQDAVAILMEHRVGGLLVQDAQGQRPGADLTKGGADLRGCGMLMMLHAVLVSDGWLEQAVVVLLACHISTRSARSGCGSREDSQENASLEKCHCSVPLLNVGRKK